MNLPVPMHCSYTRNYRRSRRKLCDTYPDHLVKNVLKIQVRFAPDKEGRGITVQRHQQKKNSQSCEAVIYKKIRLLHYNFEWRTTNSVF